MPKRIAPLTDIQVKNAKAKEKETTLFDGGGLYVKITPSGGKLWHLKYRYRGKDKKLCLGAYPAVSLADARQRNVSMTLRHLPCEFSVALFSSSPVLAD